MISLGLMPPVGANSDVYKRQEQKRKNYAIQLKAYERQQEEIARQEQLIERFKHKPTKASFARARKKMLDRMERVEKPTEDMAHMQSLIQI